MSNRGALEGEFNRVQEAVDVIQREFGQSAPVDIGIVLGSGLGTFIEELDIADTMLYSEIPHFPISKVPGHAGELWWGKVGDRPMFIMQGRAHYYEGWKLHEVVFPIRVLAALGVKVLILTNAAGAVNKALKPGDLVLIEDHINMIGRSPLRGPNIDEWGPRFPDMTRVYDLELGGIAAAQLMQLDKRSGPIGGVYACMPGPQYETPAEINMLRILGADLVGMSTVPEAIAARHMGVKVIGISCVTNMAAGIDDGKLLQHAEVVETGRRSADLFRQLLQKTIAALPQG